MPVTENYVTGTTGFLGSYLALQLLRQGEAVTSLVRGAEPRPRLLSALAKADAYAPGGPVHIDPAALGVLEGDLRLPHCGVNDFGMNARPATGGTFWHLAANLRYNERHRAGVFEDNVGGTREAVRLANSLGCARFVYVSTAYTCGRRIGHIPEQLHDRSAVFNNVYEESKCAAEHVVVEHADAAGMEWVITRPSIVIGPSATWSSGGSNSGLYGFAHRVRALRVPLRSHEAGVRLSAVPSMPLNFVAVDWVIRDLLMFGKDPASCGTIRHLTSESSVTVQDAINYVTSSLSVPTIIATEGELSWPTTIEKQLARQMEFYGNYLHYPKTFERSASSRQTIEPHQVKQAVKSFVEEIEVDQTRKPAIW
jgi:nucleoside-diphosphate-sugar epimerase